MASIIPQIDRLHLNETMITTSDDKTVKVYSANWNILQISEPSPACVLKLPYYDVTTGLVYAYNPIHGEVRLNESQTNTKKESDQNKKMNIINTTIYPKFQKWIHMIVFSLSET